MDTAARRASRKAARRLIPFLILCWLISILDRVNVGFAALTMNKELGLTAVRIRCRHLLLRLLYIRGAIQLDPGKGRRAAMDCQDHDLLGRDCYVIRFRDFRNVSRRWFLILR
jgi:hypothetical protein